MNQNKAQIYISGALTGVENPLKLKVFYESIGALCETMEFQAYVPHLKTDPINNPDVSPRQVFETDKRQVSSSDLVIAYLGCPSFGVGMELAYAEIHKIPLILLYEKDKNISRFPRGIPTVISEIKFSSDEDALARLQKILEQWSTENPTQPLSLPIDYG
ncbi:MAG: XRE family transcriptional regulator [Coleofasciculus sp. B1-GNL1-01]|uniref:XRE family transcriptional regulator n=1 Tax=Coleofasciculus sp. B1-GNL1-01 TaxID=3068484 RepID=UPI0032F89430